MREIFVPFKPGAVKLLSGQIKDRFDLNRKYLLSLKSENLLQNYYLESGLWETYSKPEDCHWGWESPTCQLRGHFPGHWLSAAARIYSVYGDTELKGKADWIIKEMKRCQKRNGGEWVFPIPEKYLIWAALGTKVWAPQYTLHKTMMGLVDMYKFTGNKLALDILEKTSVWFKKFTDKFSQKAMDDFLDVETGGMLEVWADLYEITKKRKYLDLLNRYYRGRLFDPLLKGMDPLSNKHANTTIPEILGAARAWEVTGEQRWRDVTEAYWKNAVSDRGYFCTGGQTCSEVWNPPEEFAARLGFRNQEHCTVYNMMRLADFLLRWTGDCKYGDYWERNFYNGILAQQNKETGMVSYYLQFVPGGVKKWGTPTEDFWCCHGTLVQAHAVNEASIFYNDNDDLVISQFFASKLDWNRKNNKINVTLKTDEQLNQTRRPGSDAFDLSVKCAEREDFTIKIRSPWWIDRDKNIMVKINGIKERTEIDHKGYIKLRRKWTDDIISIKMPKRLTTCPMPDEPNKVAFMDGPVVLAGLCDEEKILYGNKNYPETILAPYNEREYSRWTMDYYTKGQETGIHFIPLNEVTDQKCTVYFPVSEKTSK